MDHDLTAYFANMRIQQYKSDIGFKTLVEGVNENLYVIPPYQRKFKWKRDQIEELVRSLFQGFPIPPIYTYRNKKNQLEILDGQQRVMSLFFYYIGMYVDVTKTETFDYQKFSISEKTFQEVLQDTCELTPLSTVLWLDEGEQIDISYRKLPVEVRRKLDYTTLTIVEIRWVDEEQKGETIQQIFKNLNKGGVNLTEQEVRDGVYNCKFYDMLRKFNSNNKKWRRLWGRGSKDGRDVEALLRLCAVRHYVTVRNGEYEVEGYKGEYVTFLNKFSEYAMTLDDKFSLIEDYRKSLERFVENMDVGNTMSNRVALMESIYIVCEKSGMDLKITRNMIEEIKGSEAYKSNTTQGTSSRKKMNERWKGVYEILSRYYQSGS